MQEMINGNWNICLPHEHIYIHNHIQLFLCRFIPSLFIAIFSVFTYIHILNNQEKVLLDITDTNSVCVHMHSNLFSVALFTERSGNGDKLIKMSIQRI